MTKSTLLCSSQFAGFKVGDKFFAALSASSTLAERQALADAITDAMGLNKILCTEAEFLEACAEHTQGTALIPNGCLKLRGTKVTNSGTNGFPDRHYFVQSIPHLPVRHHSNKDGAPDYEIVVFLESGRYHGVLKFMRASH